MPEKQDKKASWLDRLMVWLIEQSELIVASGWLALVIYGIGYLAKYPLPGWWLVASICLIVTGYASPFVAVLLAVSRGDKEDGQTNEH